MVSLISDSRVQFLLWFIFVAFILAGILALIEFRLKREKEEKEKRAINELAIGKIWQFLKYDKTPREKLDFVDKTAKEYFNKTYGMPLDSGYSALVKEFEKMQRKNEVVFCKAMFETYYSNSELSNDRAVALGKLLIDIEKNKTKVGEVSQVLPSVEQVKVSKLSFIINQIKQFFEKRKWIVPVQKVAMEENERKPVEKEKELREKIKEKPSYEIKVRKEKAVVPLKENNLPNYYYGNNSNPQNSESEPLQKQVTGSGEIDNSVNVIKEGVAGRIIRKEKDRLKERDVFAVEI